MEQKTLSAEDFVDELFERMQSIDMAYAVYAKRRGLTYIGITVLEYIFDHPEGCTQKEIVDMTFFPKQSVNMVIKGLWQQGYVEMKELASDRRNKKIFLTAPGRDYAENILRPVYDAVGAAAECIPEHGRQMLLNYLRIYDEKFRESCI